MTVIRTISLSFCILCSTLLCSETLLISGKLEDESSQYFYAPWTNSWQIQIKYMMKEGSVAKVGDVVVLFDTSNLESEIESNEGELRQTEQQAKKDRLKLESDLSEAQYALKKSSLLLEKAKIEAEVPKKFRSDFEYAQYQFEYLKAKDDLARKKQAVALKQEALASGIKKQELKVQAIIESLNRNQGKLESMHLRAEIEGPVFYADHPWNGSKIQTGTTVQTNMKVALIAGEKNIRVMAWVNEVDWPKIKKNQKVNIFLESDFDAVLKGEVTSIGLQSEKRTQWGAASWYPVFISLAKHNVKVSPGMSVLVQFDAEEQPNNISEKQKQLTSVANRERLHEKN